MDAETSGHVGTPLLIYGVEMWGSIIGAGISAASSLLGGAMTASASKSAAREQVKLQREFAQNGIRWKVADAKAAGIHPLAALGAQTASYQPVQVGDTSLGSGLSEMGQNIGRAVDATLTREERKEQQRRNNLIQGMQLANQEAEMQARLASTASQIKLNDAHARYYETMASIAGQPRNPPFPSGSRASGASGFVESNVIPDMSLVDFGDGSYGVGASDAWKQRNDDDRLEQLSLWTRNKIAPRFGMTRPDLYMDARGNISNVPKKGYYRFEQDALTANYVPAGQTVLKRTGRFFDDLIGYSSRLGAAAYGRTFW